MSKISIDDRCLESLIAHWNHTQEKSGVRVVHLQSPMGSGSHVMLRLFQKQIAEGCLTWHMRFLLEELGTDTLPKIANGLWKGIRHSQQLSNLVQNRLHQAIEKSKDLDEQQHIQGMIDSLITCQQHDGQQISLPAKRPLKALVHMARIILNNFRCCILIEDADLAHSMVLYGWLDAVLSGLDPAARSLIVITSGINQSQVDWRPRGLQYIVAKYRAENLYIQPWDQQQTATYCQASGIPGDPGDLYWWSTGRPGRLMELKEWLTSQPKHLSMLKQRDFSFTDQQQERLIRTGALLGHRFSIPVVAKICGISEDDARKLFDISTEYGHSSFHDPQTSEQHWEFHHISLQQKLQAQTLELHNRLAHAVAERIERHVGTRHRGLLQHALFIHSYTNDQSSTNRLHQLMLSMESDQIWLHISDLCMSENLSWPPDIVAAALLNAQRYLYASSSSFAPRLLHWALNYCAQQNQPHLGIELLRLSARFQFNKQQWDQCRQHLEDAIHVAQLIKDKSSNADLHLDMTELELAMNHERKANIQLALLQNAELDHYQHLRYLELQAMHTLATSGAIPAGQLLDKVMHQAKKYELPRQAANIALRTTQLYIDAGKPGHAKELLRSIKDDLQYDLPRQRKWQELMNQISD